MLSRFLVCVVVVVVILGSCEGSRRVMPWMCLERCNSTTEQVQQHLQQILDHRDVIDTVAFELFNLGPNGTLVRNNLSDVGPVLHAAGFQTLAMLSSYPYPPEFLDWMRSLFHTNLGDKFIAEAVQACIDLKLSGLNVDFEPTSSASAQDGQDYAKYLDKFAKKMHEAGKILTVAIDAWSPIWDWDAIGQTAIDRVMTMTTYTSNFTRFETGVDHGLKSFGLGKLGVGMATLHLESDKHFSKLELDERFQLVEQHNVEEIDLWVAPIPDEFWPYLKSFVQTEKKIN